MKRLLKNAVLALFTLALVCAMCPAAPSAASTRKCYTISSGNTPVYSNTGLTRKIGTIYGSDQITVNTVKSAYCYVTYPISGNRKKSGYIRTSAILRGTGGSSYKARAKITTYRRPGGASYGYVSNGDTVTVLGVSGSYTQIKYPVSGGYKYGFITTANANNYVYGSSNAVNYSTVANGTYILYSGVGSNRVLDVSGASSAEGTNIQLWESNGSAAQKFNVSKQSDGWYRIANVNGRALDVDKAERRNGANVIQWGWSGATNQRWRFVNAGGGYYYIQSALGYYLDVNGAGTANGTNVQIWEKNNTNAQKWKLVSTSNSSGGAQTNQKTSQAAALVSKAKSQVGMKERRAGSDDISYNDWFYERRVDNSQGFYPWCATFVAWCADQTGILDSVIPRTENTTAMKNGLISRGGRQHLKGSGYKPVHGDIIFFGSNAGQHVGIVDYTAGNTVYYIDGNNTTTSPHGVKSSKCSLSYGSLWGFVTPNYQR